MNNVIFCFSGTGNSLYAASEIAKSLTNTVVVNIRNNNKFVLPDNLERVGFVLPVYHWSIPDYAKKYIERLSFKPSIYYFGIASCGGVPVNALNDLEAILNLRGVSLSYSAVHNNVASYVAMYEPFPSIEATVEKSKIALKSIISDINGYVKNEHYRKSVIKEIMRLIESPFLRALPHKDKYLTVNDDCISCGLCEKLCPVSNIIIKNNKPSFTHQCAQCMSCVVFCPQKAINYKNKTIERTKYHHPNVTATQLMEKCTLYK